MALAGSGTALDPWRITTMAEFLAVVRDTAASGYYRIEAELDTGAYSTLTPIGISTYGAKVIDGNGYTVRLAGTLAVSFAVVFIGVHFKNIKLHYRLTVSSSSPTFYLSFNGSFTDCSIYISRSGNSATYYLLAANSSTPYLVPKDFSRVLLLVDSNPSAAMIDFINIALSGHASGNNVVYTASATAASITKSTQPLSLTVVDGLSGGAFSTNGWWQDGVDLIPYQTEQVLLMLQTAADGVSVSRLVWLESERQARYVGVTASDGLGQFYARVRYGRSFTVYAAEDIGADELRAGRLVAAANWYLPPTDNGYIYQAGSSGSIGSVSGVAFNDQPVTIEGITFTPRPVYDSAVSARLSVNRGGSTQSILLDSTPGGGGPVIVGDPAYLDGVVEEVHPMLGTVRPLVNAEVFAFERRGSDYVPMGSAYSNDMGEFRVDTEVYGGGDIFAFAADFPGVVWQPVVSLSVGDRVRPTINNGYVYEIIEEGVASADEPIWWADAGEGTEGYIGSARAKARPYYQPVGHGPLKMTLVTP